MSTKIKSIIKLISSENWDFPSKGLEIKAKKFKKCTCKHINKKHSLWCELSNIK